MAEEEQEQQEEQDGAADLVRSMYPSAAAQSGAPAFDENVVQMSRRLGYGSIGHIGVHSGSQSFAREAEAYQKGVQAYAKAQADAAAKQKAVHPDAQFYAQSGDMAGAISIQKTKGASLFSMGEEVEVGSAGTFVIVPSGEMSYMGTDNKMHRMNISDYARMRGVKTVPFRGGDQQAENFRNTLTKLRGLMDNLDALSKEYELNNLYIGRLNPSETATRAEQLETSILLDSMAILTGTKTLGGNTSQVDVDMIKTLVPKAASSYFTNTKGNEKVRLEQLREIVLNHVMSAAKANGIDLRRVKGGPASATERKSPPPGVTVR